MYGFQNDASFIHERYKPERRQLSIQSGALVTPSLVSMSGGPTTSRRCFFCSCTIWYACLENIPSSLEGSQWTPAFMGLQWPSCRNVGVTLSFWWWGACLTNYIFWYRISNNDRTWPGKINWFSSVIGEKLRCPWPLVAEGWLLS